MNANENDRNSDFLEQLQTASPGEVAFIEQRVGETRAQFIQRMRYYAREAVMRPYDQVALDFSLVPNMDTRERFERSPDATGLATSLHYLLQAINRAVTDDSDERKVARNKQEIADQVHDLREGICKPILEKQLLTSQELQLMIFKILFAELDEKVFAGAGAIVDKILKGLPQ